MRKLVNLALQNPIVTLLSALLLVVAGLFSFKQLDIEAYPNPVPPMVEIITQPDGWSAEEVERAVTVPLEIGLAGMPGLDHVRSQSLFGLSDVKCYFTWGTDYDKARQEVINRLGFLTLPKGIQPQLSPWNAIGEVYRYILRGKGYNLEQLKTAQDWILQQQFRQIPGVIDVTGFGGETRQYQVNVDPVRLRGRGITLSQLGNAIANANINVGGQRISLGDQSYTVRGVGLIQDLKDIEGIAVNAKGGIPIRVKDVATVDLGHAPRLGQIGKDGDADIVQGIVLMRYGGSTLKTLEGVHARIDEIRKNHLLPPGMEIEPYYDRGDLVTLTTHTVMENLAVGMGLVVLVFLLFLGNPRASLMATANIPLALLAAFCGMVLTGTPANLISLGAVDIGIVVDSTVIMVENTVRHLEHSRSLNLKEQLLEAAQEVGRPMAFGTTILAVAFLPLFTLKGVEGVIFSPMARTYAFAIGGAILLAVTLTPVLGSYLLRKDALAAKLRRHTDPKGEKYTWIMARILRIYEPLLDASLRRPGRSALVMGGVVVLGMAIYPFLGGEFMPKLEEGNIYIRATLPVSVALEQSGPKMAAMREVVRRHPEISCVVSQVGRPDDGTDVSGFFNIEFYAPLKPESQWPKGVTKDSITQALSKELSTAFPGVTFGFSQMISDNVEEALSGVKGENSIKVIGPDLRRNESKGEEIVTALQNVPGVTDLGLISSLGQPSLRITPDREACARHNLNVGDVESVVQAAVGGQSLTQVYDGEKRFDLTIRWKAEARQDLDAIRRLEVPTPDGVVIPLGQLAAIIQEDSPATIFREDGHRYAPIKYAVRGRDLQSTVMEAQRQVAAKVKLPWDVHLEWSGEINSLKAATQRLMVIVPITLLLIALLAHSAVKDWIVTLGVFASIPVACTGGLLALLLAGISFSISAAMGFISIFGIAIQYALFLTIYFQRLRAQGLDMVAAARRAALDRMRPAFITSLVATLGLLPAAVSTRIGTQTQKPLALVIIGGTMTIALVLTLLQPPMVLLVHRWQERRAASKTTPQSPP